MTAVSRSGAALLRTPLTAVLASAALLVAVAVPAEAASHMTKPVKQATLTIAHHTTSGTVGTALPVKTSGGSGTGVVRFHVTGTNCSIGAASGLLNATAVTSCVVTATKAATTKFLKASSAPVSFHFMAPLPVVESPSYSTPDKASLVTTSWSSTHLLGSGPVNDSTNGVNWFVGAYYSPTDQWLYAYLTPGTVVTLTWKVTGSGHQPLANTPVTLQTQFAPGANNGKGDTDATFTAPGMSNGNLSGTTDANGMVSFTFTNTNGSANGAPNGWNSKAISGALGVAPSTTVADVAAETLEAGSGYAWTRMALQIGSETFTANPASPTVIEATDLVDLIVVSNS